MSTSHSWLPGHMQELDTAECWELMGGRSVGRVAFCTEDGPLVLPVNFVVHEGNVLFRTSPHNVIAAHLNGKPAAFEVDDVDDFTQSGWSVLVQGRAEFLESVDELPPGTKPVAWAEGTRSLFVSVRARSVTWPVHLSARATRMSPDRDVVRRVMVCTARLRVDGASFPRDHSNAEAPSA